MITHVQGKYYCCELKKLRRHNESAIVGLSNANPVRSWSQRGTRRSTGHILVTTRYQITTNPLPGPTNRELTSETCDQNEKFFRRVARSRQQVIMRHFTGKWYRPIKIKKVYQTNLLTPIQEENNLDRLGLLLWPTFSATNRTSKKEGSPPTCSSLPCTTYDSPLLRLFSGEQRCLVFSGLC